MPVNPYQQLPDHAFWRRAVANQPLSAVDPVVRSLFLISRTDRIATAGSCFAQHIARFLQDNQFHFFITETPHPIFPASSRSAFNYGIYPARFGNIYTARQLVQLFDRAYGVFQPDEDIWTTEAGILVDPFRPQIQSGGFVNELEYYADRKKHFAAVRAMFEQLDVFIFTFGLTECWLSREDDAAYPLCPGVAGGTFSEDNYYFHNFEVEDVVEDMQRFITQLREVNPDCKIILTVSPVPLIATAEPRHVLTSTLYSKSVLRVAAEKLTKRFARTAYFPAYEVITGSFNRGAYFGTDLRSVTQAGITHVMRLFARHYLSEAPQAPSGLSVTAPDSGTDSHLVEMEEIVQAMCDEEMLEITGDAPGS